MTDFGDVSLQLINNIIKDNSQVSSRGDITFILSEFELRLVLQFCCRYMLFTRVCSGKYIFLNGLHCGRRQDNNEINFERR